jgi:hypothetical protein
MSAGPLYGADLLRKLVDEIGAEANQRVIFANSSDKAERRLATAILEEAARRTGMPTHAVTARVR